MTQLRRSLFASAALAMFVSAFIACGSDTPTNVVVTPPKDTTTKTPPPIVVASVVVTGPTRLTVGRSDSVKAQPRQADGTAITGKTAAWVSSSSSIVSVGATGTITAVAPGTATLTATIDGISGSITITTTDASITSLAIAPLAGPIFIGTTFQLVTTAKDSVNVPVAIRSIVYSSTAPNVATVSPSGVVTGVAPGTTTINAAVFGATASVTVTVTRVPVSSIVFAPYDSVLHPHFPQQVVAIARDSAGNPLPGTVFTYTSGNVDIATFDSFGLLSASGFSQGIDTITVSAGGKSASTRYFVPPDSGLYIASTGATPGDPVSARIDIAGSTSPGLISAIAAADGIARMTYVTSNGTYRVRTSTSADPARAPSIAGISLLLGLTTNVPVTLRPPSSVVSIPLQPYTATITAPATAGVGSTVTVSWTFTEATQPFSFYPDAAPAGVLYWSTTAGADLTGNPVAATVSRDPVTLASTFTATFIAPATAGPVYIQVEGDGPTGLRLLYPIVFKGQPLRSITIQ